MRQLFLSAVIIVILSVGTTVRAEENSKLVLSVSSTSRVDGRPLPKGLYRIILLNRMDEKFWRAAAKKLAISQGWDVVDWVERVEFFAKPGSGSVVVDDILVRSKPSFLSIVILPETTMDRVAITVDGQVDPEHLRLLGLGHPLRSIGKKLIYQK